MPKAKAKSKAKPVAKRAGKAKRKPAPPSIRRHASGKRWYTDVERLGILSALKANDGNIAMTAKEQGVPYLTLYCWAHGRRCPEALQMQTDYEGKLADALAEIAWQAVAILPGKMDKAPVNHLTNLLDKSIEKMRILKGLPTSFGQTANVNTNVTLDPARLNESERIIFESLLAKLRGTTPDDGTGGSVQDESPQPNLSRAIPRILT